MNRAERLYKVLKDGRKRTRHEIFREAGTYMLTNNAASELRAYLRPAGLTVEHSREGLADCYQIVPLRRGDADASPRRSGLAALSQAHADGQAGLLQVPPAVPPQSLPEGEGAPPLQLTLDERSAA